MLAVIVTVDVRSEKLEEFIDGIDLNSEASLRDEPGCLRFDVHRSVDVPHRFHFYELYTSIDAFEIDHRATPHYAQWREVVRRCVVPGSQTILRAEPCFPDRFHNAPAALES